MTINNVAFQEMVFDSEMLVQDKIKIFLGGQKEIEKFASELPISWKTCLASSLPTPGIIQQIWNGLEGSSFESFKTLAKNVYRIGLVVSISKKVPLGLSYIFQHEIERGIYYENWIGGIPATNVDFQTFVNAWEYHLPISYKNFCTIHNGFLKGGNIASGFSPIHMLRINQKIMPFYGDGAANLQVYNLKESIDKADYMTYDWDHETRELSKPISFWDFADKHFTTEFSVL